MLPCSFVFLVFLHCGLCICWYEYLFEFYLGSSIEQPTLWAQLSVALQRRERLLLDDASVLPPPPSQPTSQCPTSTFLNFWSSFSPLFGTESICSYSDFFSLVTQKQLGVHHLIWKSFLVGSMGNTVTYLGEFFYFFLTCWLLLCDKILQSSMELSSILGFWESGENVDQNPEKVAS